MKIGIVGSGVVGVALAKGFIKHGYDVMIGSNTASKKAELAKQLNNQAKTGSFQDTAAFGELLVLAVKGTAAEAAAKQITSAAAGKVVIDTMNPIAETPPTNGVLSFFTTLNDSLMERLQKQSPNVRFVKAFSCIGSELMVNPSIGGARPTMFICGNEAGAKSQVAKIVHQFGFDVEDCGAVEAARAIEPLCILWCIPGILRNDWRHAFKLLR
jgi:8-hydroxy-5-deazaflavin:NADPH oxidoreductase